MEKKTTSDLLQIISAGASISLEATKTTSDLIQLASTAAKHGVRLIVIDAARKTTSDLIQIAAAGKGCVEFR